ncbi:hypothetical protein FF124_14815 [Martelella lutilitoris]|uniref:Uncharacterized protein n=1 Tax=Martelella lutilitoris TaxID=2583532 RepID=A0A5C4JND1_9HYPH|nr:hypothetical protein AZF01_11135 [Martelella sp. AD-3]TNB46827.1 hypothetical protein FF124_14815 [Martelella lutilitoris]
MDTMASFFSLVERFCEAERIAEATLSSRLFNDGKRIAALRSGRDIGVLRLARAVAWLSEHWPDRAEWPNGTARPEKPQGDAAR